MPGCIEKDKDKNLILNYELNHGQTSIIVGHCRLHPQPTLQRPGSAITFICLLVLVRFGPELVDNITAS